jgi:hypothetical protein
MRHRGGASCDEIVFATRVSRSTPLNVVVIQDTPEICQGITRFQHEQQIVSTTFYPRKQRESLGRGGQRKERTGGCAVLSFLSDGIGAEEAETKRAYIPATSESSKVKKKKKESGEIVHHGHDKAEEMVADVDEDEEIVLLTVEHPATRMDDLDPNDLDLYALLD